MNDLTIDVMHIVKLSSFLDKYVIIITLVIKICVIILIIITPI